ncbi:MAG TPA: glycine cleavage system aminomethyltransferase GcvT [Deltaproteobacteria bacterium]|nr:glycine cleavage system aminomethyltransferase GcvT [Deltaproteobacteria bacterium]HQB38032.1 glycine cleavage system aminomethyltransferase GcvT [Deltaproteobacteria bacterium]
MDLIKRTPLYEKHRLMQAQMAPFGGWDMPIQYGSIIAEHGWCRSSASLFDICHMGELLFTGDVGASGLEDCFSFSVKTIPVGRSRYGFLLNASGGIIDDLIVFRLAEERVMIVVNAATTDSDFQVIQSRLNGGCFEDITAKTGKLDLQGPFSRDVLVSRLDARISQIPYFKFMPMGILGVEALISRTGYTGELGYEIFLPVEKVGELWDLLLEDARVKPAGLGARDVLRLEVGYSLCGSDIDETITPLESGLEMFVDLSKPFVGREALLMSGKSGPARRKVAFRVNGRRSPRHGYEIWYQGQPVGHVTSGVFSPMLSSGIGIGLVRGDLAQPGLQMEVCHEGISMEVQTCVLPFYTGGSLRS